MTDKYKLAINAWANAYKNFIFKATKYKGNQVIDCSVSIAQTTIEKIEALYNLDENSIHKQMELLHKEINPIPNLIYDMVKYGTNITIFNTIFNEDLRMGRYYIPLK